MLYDIVSGRGIEITCPVCEQYSAGSDTAKNHGDGWRIPLKALEKNPYTCRCGTKYQTNMTESHWHLIIDIPEGIINQKELRKIQST